MLTAFDGREDGFIYKPRYDEERNEYGVFIEKGIVILIKQFIRKDAGEDILKFCAHTFALAGDRLLYGHAGNAVGSGIDEHGKVSHIIVRTAERKGVRGRRKQQKGKTAGKRFKFRNAESIQLAGDIIEIQIGMGGKKCVHVQKGAESDAPVGKMLIRMGGDMDIKILVGEMVAEGVILVLHKAGEAVFVIAVKHVRNRFGIHIHVKLKGKGAFYINIVGAFAVGVDFVPLLRHKLFYGFAVAGVKIDIVIHHLAHSERWIIVLQNYTLERKIPYPLLLEKGKEFFTLGLEIDYLMDGGGIIALPRSKQFFSFRILAGRKIIAQGKKGYSLQRMAGRLLIHEG